MKWPSIKKCCAQRFLDCFIAVWVFFSPLSPNLPKRGEGVAMGLAKWGGGGRRRASRYLRAVRGMLRVGSRVRGQGRGQAQTPFPGASQRQEGCRAVRRAAQPGRSGASPGWGKDAGVRWFLQGAFWRAGHGVAKPRVKEGACLRQEIIKTWVSYLVVRTGKTRSYPPRPGIKENKMTTTSLNKYIFSQ